MRYSRRRTRWLVMVAGFGMLLGGALLALNVLGLYPADDVIKPPPAAGTSTATDRATSTTSTATTAPRPTATTTAPVVIATAPVPTAPVTTPVSGTVAPAPTAIVPTRTPEPTPSLGSPLVTPTPTPAPIIVTPGPGATPIPAPTPPAVEPVATPAPVSTPIPVATVPPVVTPAPQLAPPDPDCLHCWWYPAGPLPQTDTDYIATEAWLRAHFTAVFPSAPVDFCDTCPWQVLKRGARSDATRLGVIEYSEVISADRRAVIVWTLSDPMLRALAAIAEDGNLESQGVLVAIGADASALEAASMLSYPSQNFPRYTPETLVLTTAGFRTAAARMATLPPEPTPTPVVVPGPATWQFDGFAPTLAHLPLEFCTAWDADLPREPFRVAVREAMAAWNTALDVVALTYAGDCADNDVSMENGRNEALRLENGALAPASGLGPHGYTDWGSRYEADIIVASIEPSCLVSTVTHEFGHALGLGHSLERIQLDVLVADVDVEQPLTGLDEWPEAVPEQVHRLADVFAVGNRHCGRLRPLLFRSYAAALELRRDGIVDGPRVCVGACGVLDGEFRPVPRIPGLRPPFGQPLQSDMRGATGPAVREEIAQASEVVDVGEFDVFQHERRLQRLLGRLLRVKAGRSHHGWIFAERHADHVQVLARGAQPASRLGRGFRLAHRGPCLRAGPAAAPCR